MSRYYDTSSRADERLPSDPSAHENHYSLTDDREPRGFLIKVYALMYGAGLAWIATFIAMVITFVKFLTVLFLRLSWTTVSAIGSHPEQPDLQLVDAGLTLLAAVGLTALAVLATRATRRVIDNGPTPATVRS